MSPMAVALLRECGDVRLADIGQAPHFDALEEADVVWVRLKRRIDAELMSAAPRLRVIVTPTTGLNHIDLDEADASGNSDSFSEGRN